MKPIPREKDGQDEPPTLHGFELPLFELEHFLPYRLSILANRVSKAVARLYASRFDMTIPEWRVLAVVGRFGPLTATDVGSRTEMDKVQVSRSIARLLDRGLIERRTDPNDRRRMDLRLTEQGRVIHGEIVPLARSVEMKLLATLDEASRAALINGLEKLESVLNAFDAEFGAESDVGRDLL